MPGTRRFRSACLPCRIAPKKPRNRSGSRKLKNAALGLRQNIRRSRRYWRQVSVSASGIGGQLQIDVLERGASNAQLAQRLPARQGLAGQLVQQAPWGLGLGRYA